MPTPKNYALKFPEPIPLWKWAARNSKRADGLPLGMVDFYKRCVRTSHPQPGEIHAAFVRRALLDAVRAVIVQRKAEGKLPPWVEDLFAEQTGNAEKGGSQFHSTMPPGKEKN